MKLFTFKSIRTRLTYWFLILSLGPLMATLILTYFQRVAVIESRTFDKLTAIRDLKVERLNDWLNEREGDLKTIAADNELSELEYVIDDNASGPNVSRIKNNVTRILNRYLNNYPSYYKVFVINPKNGEILISTENNLEGDNVSHKEYFTEPMETKELSLTEIYFSNSLSEYTMDYSIPIFGTYNDEIVGILVARTNLNSTLYNQLRDRVGLGQTGETLIVNEDVIALNDLRWKEDPPLTVKINAAPAVLASQGKTGLERTLDYRDFEVLAAYTYIPQTRWGFVCKQDMEELNSPIRAMLWNFVIMFIVFAVIIFIIAWFIGRSVSKPIVQMAKVTRDIQAGDYSKRNIITTGDEIGSLAQMFNNMAETIESRMKVQSNTSEISELIVHQSSLQDFGTMLLKQLMEITDANMSVFYILNEDTEEFEIFKSVGANEKMLAPFNSVNPAGEIGNAISTKSMYYLRDIPDNTTFKYKTSAGDAIPKEIITIPLLNENIVVALISLVNIHKFDSESLQVLELGIIGITASYSNLMASERSRILAEQLSRINQSLEVKSEELADQTEELQDQAEELQRTSEELQEQNAELDAQKVQVELANKLKSEFLSNMSHELRTPLNSIMALSNVLITQSKSKLNEEENNYLKIVERNGRRLLALINDILDLSKIEAGKMDIIPTPLSLRVVISTIIDNMDTLAKQKGLDFKFDFPEDVPNIENDEAKLYQVLTNIISNAVKFTGKGSVKVSVKHDSKNVFIYVEDTGIGITKEILPHIFDEFRQADGSTSRNFEGTGLGLAIAKKMIAILGGDISVTSQFGIGTVFTIKLPISWHEEIISIAPDDSEDSQLLPDVKTILVVDDEERTVEEISEYLRLEGYRIISATSGKEALKLAEKHQPTAITLDIVMPEMDGFEVLQKLKSNPSTKNIPVILVSITEDKETGIALGAMGFANKPIDKDLLISEIKLICSNPVSIMIVDDNEFELNQIAKIIEDQNIPTILATGGEECIKLLKDKIPDVLVLDLMMPGMDGFQVLEKIRKAPETRDLPVIIVTAKDLTKEDKVKLMGEVSSVITKSDTTSHELFTDIKRILKELDKPQVDNLIAKENSETHVLIVEDNEDAIIQLKLVLESENYKYDIARGGEEALEYVKHTIPDGIILDLMMPGIDGFEVLKKIRNTERTKKIPILVLTAKDLTRKDLAKLSSNNIQQLLHKGDVDFDELLYKIKLMLGNEPQSEKKSEKPKVDEKKNKKENGSQKRKIQRSKKPVKRIIKDGDPPKVLIIEDNLDNMITIKAILGQEYNISEAVDGEQGLSFAQSLIPDLILLDMSLPKMSGEEVIGLLRSNSETANIPIIAVTAQAMIGDKEHFINIGCDGYVSKPIDSGLLRNEIGKVVGNNT